MQNRVSFCKILFSLVALALLTGAGTLSSRCSLADAEDDVVSTRIDAAFDLADPSERALSTFLALVRKQHGIKQVEVIWRFYPEQMLAASQDEMKNLPDDVVAVPQWEFPANAEEVAQELSNFREQFTRQWWPGQFKLRFDLSPPIDDVELLWTFSARFRHRVTIDPDTLTPSRGSTEEMERTGLRGVRLNADIPLDPVEFPEAVLSFKKALGDLVLPNEKTEWSVRVQGPSLSVRDYLKVLGCLGLSSVRTRSPAPTFQESFSRRQVFSVDATSETQLIELENREQLETGLSTARGVKAQYHSPKRWIWVTSLESQRIAEVAELFRKRR